MNNCTDPSYDEELGENNAECSNEMNANISDEYEDEFKVDKSMSPEFWPALQCIEAKPNESAEDACERTRSKWTNQGASNPKAITPLHSYDTKGGKCILCKLSFY